MYEDEGKGGTLEVDSRGQFSNIIDLDKSDNVKVYMRRRAKVGHFKYIVVKRSLS